MRELENPTQSIAGLCLWLGLCSSDAPASQAALGAGFLPGEKRVCTQALLRLQLPALLGEADTAFASTDLSRGRLQ